MARKKESWLKKVTLTVIFIFSVIIFLFISTNGTLPTKATPHEDIDHKKPDHELNLAFRNPDPELFGDKIQRLKVQYHGIMTLLQELKEACSVLWQPDCVIPRFILTQAQSWSVEIFNNLHVNDMVNDSHSNITIPDVKISDVSCSKLFQGDDREQKFAFKAQDVNPKRKLPDRTYIEMSRDCIRFLSERRYITVPISKEEEDFPLAFSILIFQDVEQFERLLRAIYRPQNYYCIHVDKKSDKFIHDTVSDMSRCFSNVFVASRWFDVAWGTFSIVEPELACMEELLKYKKWKYFINLTGQEFPLKTNWEIVQILRVFNGANNLEGTVVRRNADRVHPARPVPPVNVTLTKGSVHVTASRAFVEYIIHDNNSLLFRDWVKDTYVSDETYFSSLNHSPQLGVPGSYLGVPETDTKKNLFITRFKNWGDGPFNWPCGGKRVRQVCVFGIKDLPLLSTRPELFANKFHLYYEPLTYDCLEELHYEKIRSELNGTSSFNTTFYESLDFVTNHLI